MLEELRAAITNYWTEWERLVADRTDQAFFASLTPTATGWKTVDLADFDTRLAELRPYCDLINQAWINERWVATLHLKSETLPHNIRLIKLMQRRPGSTDATGLDHIDFYNTAISQEKLAQEPDLKWNEETNGVHCKWLSVWFAGGEAKLRTETVLQVCADELLDAQKTVVSA